MATTKIWPIHRGELSAGRVYKSKIDYITKSEKTAIPETDERFISTFGCMSKYTAPDEFDSMLHDYELRTGRTCKDGIIANHVIQSFKPGEVTPEEAHRIGGELAKEFLKDRYAYVLSTHVDKEHIHNHLFFCAVNLDCDHKWSMAFSAMAVAKISDRLCEQHGLSVLPPKKGRNPARHLGKAPSHRDILRADIGQILTSPVPPKTWEEFTRRLEDGYGYTVEKHTVTHPKFKKPIRFKSLGVGFTEFDLKEILDGRRQYDPLLMYRHQNETQRVIRPEESEAIRKKMQSPGYHRWATIENLKRMARTAVYLEQNDLKSTDLKELIVSKREEYDHLADAVARNRKDNARLNALKKNLERLTPEVQSTLGQYLELDMAFSDASNRYKEAKELAGNLKEALDETDGASDAVRLQERYRELGLTVNVSVKRGWFDSDKKFEERMIEAYRAELRKQFHETRDTMRETGPIVTQRKGTRKSLKEQHPELNPFHEVRSKALREGIRLDTVDDIRKYMERQIAELESGARDRSEMLLGQQKLKSEIRQLEIHAANMENLLGYSLDIPVWETEQARQQAWKEKRQGQTQHQKPAKVPPEVQTKPTAPVKETVQRQQPQKEQAQTATQPARKPTQRQKLQEERHGVTRRSEEQPQAQTKKPATQAPVKEQPQRQRPPEERASVLGKLSEKKKQVDQSKADRQQKRRDRDVR